MEHHHTFWQWVHYHWAEISMVWFPAFLGYLNAFAASCKVMGWTSLADFLGKLEDALATFVSNVRSQKQTSTGGTDNVGNNSSGSKSDPGKN